MLNADFRTDNNLKTTNKKLLEILLLLHSTSDTTFQYIFLEHFTFTNTVDYVYIAFSIPK
jgi:hypothetical protein